MDIAIMIEGQNGLTWPRWQRMARAVEDLGFAGLYRSDHFTNASAPDVESLELWTSLTWLASHTSRIEFGPLVSPVSVRHPAITARTAAAIDDLSGGRLTLGVGAGWQVREHTNYGFDLLELKDRFDRYEEGLQVIKMLLQNDLPVDFSGHYYNLKEAVLLPRPLRPGGPKILVGGNGARRTLKLAAQYANEWNAVFVPPSEFVRLSAILDENMALAGRAPGSIRRSLMTGCIFGRDEQRLEALLAGRPADALRQRGLVVAAGSQVADQVGAYAQAGVQRLMLQWLNLDDMDGLEALAQQVL